MIPQRDFYRYILAYPQIGQLGPTYSANNIEYLTDSGFPALAPHGQCAQLTYANPNIDQSVIHGPEPATSTSLSVCVWLKPKNLSTTATTLVLNGGFWAIFVRCPTAPVVPAPPSCTIVPVCVARCAVLPSAYRRL